MPLYAFACPEDHEREVFHHVREDLGTITPICDRDGQSMSPVLSAGRGLTWFRENHGQVIWNMGPEPVTVRSHEEHKRLMRERGLEWATKWTKEKTGGWV